MLSWSVGGEVSAGFLAALEELPVPLQAPHGLWKGVSPLWYNIGYVDITQTVHIGSAYA